MIGKIFCWLGYHPHHSIRLWHLYYDRDEVLTGIEAYCFTCQRVITIGPEGDNHKTPEQVGLEMARRWLE